MQYGSYEPLFQCDKVIKLDLLQEVVHFHVKFYFIYPINKSLKTVDIHKILSDMGAF